jgi:release factor glutamine methyltransferase
MVRRRVMREPVAYILGRKGFRQIEVGVDARVLIPRPETELLVEAALDAGAHRKGRQVLDVGTGSGAVAIAVADEIPEARVIAIDASLDALRVAQANADRLGLSDRVDLVLAGFGSLPAAGPDGEPFEIVLANLPYVSEAEWERLQPEIREYEPREALVAGPSGLEAIEALLSALRYPGPYAIALEVGAGQAKRAEELAKEAGFARTSVTRDLAGVERVVSGVFAIPGTGAR